MHPLAATKFADCPRDFIDSCLTMHLTIKRGPKAGTTLVYCTCGWEHTYPTVVGAKRGENAHLRLNAAPTPAPAGGDAAPTSRGDHLEDPAGATKHEGTQQL